MDLEDIDLARLARHLHDRFGGALDESYLDGRTRIRDALVDQLCCTTLEAEAIVDTMEAREYLRFPTLADETHLNRPSRWRIGVPAAER